MCTSLRLPSFGRLYEDKIAHLKIASRKLLDSSNRSGPEPLQSSYRSVNPAGLSRFSLPFLYRFAHPNDSPLPRATRAGSAALRTSRVESLPPPTDRSAVRCLSRPKATVGSPTLNDNETYRLGGTGIRTGRRVSGAGNQTREDTKTSKNL